MLKTFNKDEMWFVSQPDHAAVCGYLAAHWGNEDFAQPGHYQTGHCAAVTESTVPAAERLRAEVILANSQHDNGWWEWEADPELSATNLPVDLAEVRRDRQESMDRWRWGIPRLSEHHPYASLLISWHAYWLNRPNLPEPFDHAFRHPLAWNDLGDSTTSTDPAEVPETRAFLEEIAALQAELEQRLQADHTTQSWLAAEHLHPHVRLLQILDGVSLSLCSTLVPPHDGPSLGQGRDAFHLLDVPRGSWDDRVTIEVTPLSERRVRYAPYPFALDPLPVFVPTKIFPANMSTVGSVVPPYPIAWNAMPPSLVRYEFVS